MPDFRPFEMKGRGIDESIRNWTELNIQPYDKLSVDAYTRCRVILMNGVENNSVLGCHVTARMTQDQEQRRVMALVRRADSQHQQLINWLNPADQTVIETTIGYEQVAVDLTSDLALNEPDPYVKQALDFALLEDFDHLFRYGCLLELAEGMDPNLLTQGRTEIKPGRPTVEEHRHPDQSLRHFYDKDTTALKTKLNYHTIVSAEQQTMLFYKAHGMQYLDPLARGLYTEIAEIEQQHVSQYEALGDPKETPLEKLALMQLTEAYLYHSNAQTEPDPRLRSLWEQLAEEEIGHFLAYLRLIEKAEGRDLREVLGADMVSPLVTFHENKDYVNQILASQLDLRPLNKEFVHKDELPADWASFAYAERVNAGWVPSEEVTQRAQAQNRLPGVAMEQPQPSKKNKDIFSLIMADHEQVKQMFEELLSGQAKNKQALFKELSSALYAHLRAEEEILYGPLKDNPVTHSSILEGIEEHFAVRQMLIRMITGDEMSHEEWKEKLTVLRDMILHHVTEEQGVMFQHIRQVMDEQAAMEAGERFQARKKDIMASGGPSVEQVAEEVRITPPGAASEKAGRGTTGS